MDTPGRWKAKTLALEAYPAAVQLAQHLILKPWDHDVETARKSCPRPERTFSGPWRVHSSAAHSCACPRVSTCGIDGDVQAQGIRKAASRSIAVDQASSWLLKLCRGADCRSRVQFNIRLKDARVVRLARVLLLIDKTSVKSSSSACKGLFDFCVPHTACSNRDPDH